MPKYKITKKRATHRKGGRFYREGCPIELSTEEAGQLKDKLGLVSLSKSKPEANQKASQGTKKKKPAGTEKAKTPDTNEADDGEEEPAKGDTALDVLNRGDYQEMLSYVAEHSAEPLEARSHKYLKKRLTEWADESS